MSWDTPKYIFWRAITPAFLGVRDALLALRIIHHKGRQRFLLGTIPQGKDIQAFVAYMQSQGFSNHFIAWQDDGQMMSLRRFDGSKRQYHLRVFEDREVRGHYEYTPEIYPWAHFKETDMEARRDEFLAFLGGWVEPSKD
jgi:hypothetical protein